MPETIAGELYNHPRYYDLLYGSDWKAEFDFLLACFERYASRRVKRLFEPACGTGRLLARFAQAGYDVAGNDLNARAVHYCNARLKRLGFAPSAVVADMANFQLRPTADAAFNMINSFRHLPSEAAAMAHLQCMARAIESGGIYALGLHLTPTHAPRCEGESWSARRGHLGINTRMESLAIDQKARRETVRLTCDIYTPRKQFRLVEEMAFRTYSLKQFERLLAKVPEFQWIASHDFAYDIDDRYEPDAASEDVVFILRRR